MIRVVFVFFKQKTAYERRISDWSSDVCSSDLFHTRDLSQAGICMSLFAALFLRIARIRYSEGAPRRLGSTRKAEQIQKFQNLIEELGRASCRERVCQSV